MRVWFPWTKAPNTVATINMYEKFAQATRQFEEQVSLITRIYERGLRMAHESYYDAITGIGITPQPACKPEPPQDKPVEAKPDTEGDAVQDALDMIFQSYADRK